MNLELVVGTAKQPKMNGSDGRGVLQIDKGTVDVSLWGSLITNDATATAGWVLIETFTTDVLKEIVLTPYMAVSGSATDVTAPMGTSTAYIDETR